MAPDLMHTKSRPVLLTVIAILFLTLGILLLIPGLAMLYPGVSLNLDFDFDSAGRHVDLLFNRVRLVGLCLIVGGTLAATGRGLWKLQNWARISAQTLLSLLVVMTAVTSVPPPMPKAGDAETGIIICAVCVLLIWYLRRPAVKAHFARDGH
jgi:Ca2+/H+ antiporter